MKYSNEIYEKKKVHIICILLTEMVFYVKDNHIEYIIYSYITKCIICSKRTPTLLYDMGDLNAPSHPSPCSITSTSLDLY